MQNWQIVFTGVNTAELLQTEYRAPREKEVAVATAFSTVSCGTEKANIMGNPHIAPLVPEEKASVTFPRQAGYSSAGTVIATGKNVERVKAGDRVVVYWGKHAKYNTVLESQIVKIEEENLSFQEAALSFIATFPLAAIRKTRLEIGEAALVMGLGLLGQLAIRLLRAAGAVPIVGIDPVEARRLEALHGGADYVLDPAEKNFADVVREKTHGGANVAIEVTGVGAGLNGALDCMARFGRVALLGCTRNKDFTVDYYRKVHFPGITLIGAHTMARPSYESHPGYFTHEDDIKAVLRLCESRRIDLKSMIKEVHSPQECPEVYQRLVCEADFPVAVQFDWRKVP